MKNVKFLQKAGTTVLTAALGLTPVAGVFAAEAKMEASPQAEQKAGAYPGDSIIDTTRPSSITIHKYDKTAYLADNGADALKNDMFKSTGEENTKAEEALRDYVIKDVEFTAAYISGIEQIKEAGKTQVLYTIPDGLRKVLKLSEKSQHGDYKYNTEELNKALAALLKDQANTTGKNALEKWVVNAQDAKSLVTDANGEVTLDNAKQGLWLIVETKVPANVHTTTDPFFVTTPMTNNTGSGWFYDVHVYPKNQTNIPDLEKKVRQRDDASADMVGNKHPEYKDIATGSEGDVMDYILVSRLPSITSEATYLKNFTFEDKLAAGLTYGKDAVIKFYSDKNSALADDGTNLVATWNHGDPKPKFTETYNGETGLPSMTISLTEAGLKEINATPDDANVNASKYSQMWMVVKYSARMNSDAGKRPVLGDTGNTNDVKLTYNRTYEQNKDTLSDRARVYTYGINLVKEGEENRQTEDPQQSAPFDASKVAFVLQNKTNGHYVNGTVGVAGVYEINDEAKGANENQATKFSPAADGQLIINGLEADDYILTEVKTAPGYTLLKDPIEIHIDQTIDTFRPTKTTLYDTKDIAKNETDGFRAVLEENKDRAKATVDGNPTNMSTDRQWEMDSNNARVDMTVINTPGFTLPMTGGTGTILFTVAGAVVMICGVAIVMKKKQNPEK